MKEKNSKKLMNNEIWVHQHDMRILAIAHICILHQHDMRILAGAASCN